MPTYEPSPFVEPLGYQPVEFLDIPAMNETRELWSAPQHDTPEGRHTEITPEPAMR
jgi:hypothetical protein